MYDKEDNYKVKRRKNLKKTVQQESMCLHVAPILMTDYIFR